MFKTLKYAAGFAALTFFVATQFNLNSASAFQPPTDLGQQGYSHYKTRLHDIKKQKPLRGGFLFLGDSITEGCDWQQAFPNYETRNQGIGWDTSTGLKSRLGLVSRHNPDKILMLIGVNDLAKGTNPKDVVSNVMTSIRSLSLAMPETEIIVQSALPSDFTSPQTMKSYNHHLQRNIRASRLRNVGYLNVYSHFVGYGEKMSSHLTYDGTHLNQLGCEHWAKVLQSTVL